ncbi:hemerythrin domain-containing protein [Hydrogenophaga sp.]|jgi:hemerythrin-like domain-containing protein|uniref:hemerythrin domain-containing protein n=1 Tax=Hydrogenophaga sp. TaxID=1904254 RepID=UPI003F720AAD
MNREALHVIRDEHAGLAAMLQSLLQMIQRGPEPAGKDQHELFFDVLRAMLFYIGEFPEKLHHPKESDLLFPRLARAAPQVMATIEQLERDHMAGESKVKELMHLLMAWEYLGETRRPAFEAEARSYVAFYLEHMRLEESVVLPEAERSLDDGDWHALDVAFATNRDPLNRRIPRDPQFDRLFTRIVMCAPAPVGLGEG